MRGGEKEAKHKLEFRLEKRKKSQGRRNGGGVWRGRGPKKGPASSGSRAGGAEKGRKDRRKGDISC